MAFFKVNNFIDQNDQKNICASIVFKAESEHEENIFWGFVFKNPKHAFSGVKINSFKNSNFKVSFAFVLLC